MSARRERAGAAPGRRRRRRHGVAQRIGRPLLRRPPGDRPGGDADPDRQRGQRQCHTRRRREARSTPTPTTESHRHGGDLSAAPPRHEAAALERPELGTASARSLIGHASSVLVVSRAPTGRTRHRPGSRARSQHLLASEAPAASEPAAPSRPAPVPAPAVSRLAPEPETDSASSMACPVAPLTVDVAAPAAAAATRPRVPPPTRPPCGSPRPPSGPDEPTVPTVPANASASCDEASSGAPGRVRGCRRFAPGAAAALFRRCRVDSRWRHRPGLHGGHQAAGA